MIEYRAGDTVEVTTGSAKTGNLRTLHGVVTGWTLRPVEGNDTHAFRVYTVATIEGIVTEAASRITLVRCAADVKRETDTLIDSDAPVADARAAAELAWQTHKRVATSNDPAVCASNSPIYRASQRLLLAAIRAAYGLSTLMAVRVYDTLIESGEPVSWSVEYVRSASRRPRTLHAAQCSCIPGSSDSPDIW